MFVRQPITIYLIKKECSNMEKIAIIGGGIIGMTLANYIDQEKFSVSLFDGKTGQATSASAGIISPWLSKRRNKKWYHLAKDGAAFFPKLVQDLSLDDSIYYQSGTLLLRADEELDQLAELAEERKQEAPEIGTIERLTPEQTASALPLLRPVQSLKISGGGRLDGKAYLQHLRKLASAKGTTFFDEKITLSRKNGAWLVSGSFGTSSFDRLVLTPGPSLASLLEQIGYQADIRPQKGQLLVFETEYAESRNWPVAILDGEADLIPFNDGKILIGATHENDGGWDLSPSEAAYQQLTTKTAEFLTDSADLLNWPYHFRVGTRAYTSDFAPFFGPVLNDETLLAASGLGSSGLTTGPYIGYLLADYLNNGRFDTEHYQKPIATYIKKA
jgi:glycine/D-amino acid oxidase-like deaminating enzyme